MLDVEKEEKQVNEGDVRQNKSNQKIEVQSDEPKHSSFSCDSELFISCHSSRVNELVLVLSCV